MSVDRLRFASCPQCGAPVTVPQSAVIFACPWCKVTLRNGQGVPLHFLVEEPRLDQDTARRHAAAWLSGSGFPGDLQIQGNLEVGAAAHQAFLRVRRRELDTVQPLTPIALPEVLHLARVPGDLRPLADDVDISVVVDPAALREAIAPCLGHEGIHDLVVEQRVYYPVTYAYKGERFTAVVPGAGGQVLAERRPLRRDVLGERGLAAAVVALLFAEALLLPGLPLKMSVVAGTGLALYPVLNWVVRRYG